MVRDTSKLCGCNRWTLIKGQMKRTKIAEMWFLKAVGRQKMSDHKHNEHVQQGLGNGDISAIIKSKRNGYNFWKKCLKT